VPISGATTSSYKLTYLDVGHDDTVIVTATDKEAQAAGATATAVGPVTSS
jgi:hypothetical protein